MYHSTPVCGETSFMPTSHCPETLDGHPIKEMFKFGSDRKNIGPFVRASYIKTSSDRRWSFSGSSSNFVNGGKMFGMPKDCRRTLQRLIFVLNSCVHFVFCKAIVRASYQIMSTSSLLCVFVIVLGRQHDYVKPSPCRRVSIVLE